MSYSIRTKDNSIHRDQVTADLRHKRKGRSVTIVNEAIEQNPTEKKPQDFFTDYIVRLKKTAYKWVQTAIKLLKAAYRSYLVFLKINSTFGLPTGVWVVLPYLDVKMVTEKYNVANYRYYSIKRGSYFVNAALYYAPISINSFATNAAEIAVFLNGSYFATLDLMVAATSSGSGINDGVWLNGAITVPMQCGDYVDIRFKHESGSDYQLQVTDSHYGYLSVNYEGSNYKESGLSVPIRT